jgi:hypothetical protein
LTTPFILYSTHPKASSYHFITPPLWSGRDQLHPEVRISFAKDGENLHSKRLRNFSEGGNPLFSKEITACSGLFSNVEGGYGGYGGYMV